MKLRIKKIDLEGNDTMCEDEVQEQLVEDATHDVDESGARLSAMKLGAKTTVSMV